VQDLVDAVVEAVHVVNRDDRHPRTSAAPATAPLNVCVCCTNARGFDLTDGELESFQGTAKQAEVKASMRKQDMALILRIGDNPRNDFIQPKSHETGNGLGLTDLILIVTFILFCLFVLGLLYLLLYVVRLA
jgi:hypothetical protein